MSFPCANTYYLNQYLRQMDEEDRREHAVASIASAMQEAGKEMDPASSGNIVEAMQEIFEGRSASLLIRAIQEAMKDGRPPETAHAMHKVGLLFVGAIRSYWYEKACKKAGEQVANASCRACFGRGCNRCDPMEAY